MDKEWAEEIERAFKAIDFGCEVGCIVPPKELTEGINNISKNVEGFTEADLSNFQSFSLYRTFLYVLIRNARPQLVIETGVLNGFSSAFILQALHDNGCGKLLSVDLPHESGEYEDQGTFLLPKGLQPGWGIPDYLRDRHELHLGQAEILLPQLIDAHGAPDVFLHDSDHRYPHMMMEIALAWSRMTSGLILADNVEQNSAFQDFAKGVEAKNYIVNSYNSSERVWQHGVMRK